MYTNVFFTYYIGQVLNNTFSVDPANEFIENIETIVMKSRKTLPGLQQNNCDWIFLESKPIII